MYVNSGNSGQAEKRRLARVSTARKLEKLFFTDSQPLLVEAGTHSLHSTAD